MRKLLKLSETCPKKTVRKLFRLSGNFPDCPETFQTSGHCSVTLEDGSVMTTGGRRDSTPSGSPKMEVYNFTSKFWTRKADLRMRRFNHSCTQVWLNTEDPDVNGIVQTGTVSNNSVLSVVVAGGKFL